jgi:fatty acid desaturase
MISSQSSPADPVVGSTAMSQSQQVSRFDVVAKLRDLYTPSPAVYWSDLLASALAGWTAFALACWTSSPALIAASLGVSTLLLYRAFLFIHELSHSARRIPGFQTAWNLLAGFPLLVPSCFAVGVHTHHHSPRSYGTVEDPEYLAFGRSRWLVLRFMLQSLALPWLCTFRFLVAAPLALLIPLFHQWLERHATSLAMNSSFVRRVGSRQHWIIVRQELGLLLLWAPLIALICFRMIPLRVLSYWLLMATGIAALNGVRTLAAHRYVADGSALDRQRQLADSIDTPGGPWTELWAPVGHRYHALHHYAPALPYHNLGAAYRRFTACQPQADILRQTTRRSLCTSLAQLWRHGAHAPEPREPAGPGCQFAQRNNRRR